MNFCKIKKWWIISLLVCAAPYTAAADTGLPHQNKEAAVKASGAETSVYLNSDVQDVKNKALENLKNHSDKTETLKDKEQLLDEAYIHTVKPLLREDADELQGQNELTLFDAESYALEHSPSLQANRYSAAVSHEQLGQWLSSIYPNVSFSAGFTHSGTFDSSESGKGSVVDPSTGSIINVGTGRNTHSTSRVSGSLSIKQTLFDLSRRFRLRKAELSELSSLADLESARQSLLYNVRKNWFTCYIDQELLDIALDKAANRKIRLDQAEQSYKAGTKAKSDVVSAQSDLASAQNEVIKAQTRLKLDWVALNTVMGLDADIPYRLVLNSYWNDYADADTETLVKTAFANRPELLKLKTQLKSALNELEIINSDRYPSVSLNGSLGLSGSLSPIESSWSVGVSVNWSIFDGFMRRYQESAQKLQALSLAKNFDAQRLAVYQEVRSAQISLRQSKAAAATAEYSLASAQEKYRLASARYKVGVGSSVEAADAELSLSQAQTDYASACGDLRMAKASMIKALGVDDMDNLPELKEEITLDKLPDAPKPYNSDSEDYQDRLKIKTSRLGEEK